VVAEIRGFKIRHDPRSDSFTGLAYVDRDRDAAPFDFPGDLTPHSLKPRTFERQPFGLWRGDLTQVPAAEKVQMTMRHLCGTRIVYWAFGSFKRR